MQKLKALQKAKAEAQATAAAPAAETTTTTTESNTTETQNGAAPAKTSSTGNVFSLKKSSVGAKKSKTNAAQLRVQKDMSEMDEIPGTKIRIPDQENLMKFEVDITPTDGLYRGACFQFNVDIPNSYPYDPPKVLCNTPVYHPNIDNEGKVCLNILRQEWFPVLSLGSVIFGLMTLFLEPNPDDPLNKEAAQLMVEKPKEFERNVRDALRGGNVAGRKFPKLL
ncbi:ubiquitin-conjugating enzyme E2 M [Planoprotostelium fungivorum]|uniref:Ubiquitin-conjugating enzyme E2 M n=1 Tax=Planoprotostelium fungivorum TaxID=1890364 RepID=A0A2P6N8Y4_9EUKA|nr:ubiquitin-conjugating enzyme E2 M [Planoprotostelium fungivorum]